MKIIFITGGARSGKSSFALRQAEKIRGKKLFIATATALDAEMRERIELHRNARNKDWNTAEEPTAIGRVLKSQGAHYKVILIDCLTLWLFNTMDGHAEISDRGAGLVQEIDALVNGLLEIQQSPQRFDKLSSIFIVSNEVGMGIVPDNKAGRIFRDMAGQLNQKVARMADDVYLMVSGLPLQVK
jgi:adenosylcobinamide kinase/adenosylcobinamide-phosphate guanylyltransferase